MWNKGRVLKYMILGPYSVLSLIPGTFGCLGIYNYLITKRIDEGRAWMFYSWTGWLCLPLSAAMIVAIPPTMVFDPVRKRPLERIQRIWGKLSLMPFIGNDTIEIESVNGGLEMMQDLMENKKVPVITLSNHNSWLDIYALFFLDVPIRFVSKKEIFYIPVVGWVMGVIGHMYLDRNDKISKESLVDRTAEKLHMGLPLVHFFPEGTRSRNGQLGEFKIGAFSTAVRAHVPCIPIQILGTRDIMPETTTLRAVSSNDIKKARIRIRVFPPVYPTQDDDVDKDEFLRASRLRETCRNILVQLPTEN